MSKDVHTLQVRDRIDCIRIRERKQVKTRKKSISMNLGGREEEGNKGVIRQD